MPMQYTPTSTGGTGYGDPFVGRPGPAANGLLDVSTMSTNEVDEFGFVKPGVIVTITGASAGAATDIAYGVVPEPTKIPHATIPPTNASLLADTAVYPIGVFTSGLLNRDIIEDNLGRALTANELLALVGTGAGGFKLTPT